MATTVALTFIRRLFRGLLWMAAAWALAALVSVAIGGVWVPPVLKKNGPAKWSVDGLGYPPDASLCSCPTTDDLTLRGFFIPADEGAPIVVHFAESGCSGFDGAKFRHQYEGLAHVGFASLVMDYRGVGASEGERAPAKLGEDAAAIYAYARELVGGDESRLVLRGCSVGTVAAASLLEAGARPGAAVVWAPVEARSVARRFAAQRKWKSLLWLADPFLRSFESARTVDQLLDAPCPVFAAASPYDPLLDAAELDRLSNASEQGRLTLYIPPDVGEGRGLPFLTDHAALASSSYRIGREEAAFLHGAFPHEPATARRADELLAAVDPTWLGELPNEPRFREALKSIASFRRDLLPEAAVAAAAVLSESSLAQILEDQGRICSVDWFTRPPFYRGGAEGAGPRGRDHYRGLDEMLAVFRADAGDEGQGLLLGAADTARRTLRLARGSDGGLLWTPDRLLALVRALRGDTSDPFVFEASEAESPPALGPFAGLTVTRQPVPGAEPLITVDMVLVTDDGPSKIPINPQRLFDALEISSLPITREEERRLLTCLLRATWHSHEVKLDPTGDWTLIERDRGGPR